MTTIVGNSSVRRPHRRLFALCSAVVVGALVIGCGATTSTARPSASLITLDFTPLPTSAATPTATRTPARSTIPASWPVGWDIAFCTALADTTVAHELVIDIERAIVDGNSSDAQGLSNELAQTAPVAGNEINRLSTWDPVANLKTNLAAILGLDAQVATAYQSYFNDGVKTGLHDARKLRDQVRKQVGPINDELQQLSATGLICPGTNLKLETF